jgi:hypothetical protein
VSVRNCGADPARTEPVLDLPGIPPAAALRLRTTTCPMLVLRDPEVLRFLHLHRLTQQHGLPAVLGPGPHPLRTLEALAVMDAESAAASAVA